jgi:hypothetical protein
MDKDPSLFESMKMQGGPRNLAVSWLISFLVCLGSVLTSSQASEVDLRLSLVGQGYQTRTAAGELLDRRRLTQWVDLRAQRLLDIEGFSFETSFRFDAEFGFGDDLEAMGGNQAELMLAQIRWREIVDRLDLTLGRQLIFDEIDILLFDGVRIDFHFPAFFSVRLLTGFSVRDRSFLGGSVLELDGVEESSVPVPLIGANLGFRYNDLWINMDYHRKVLWETDWPLDEERLGASISLRLWEKRIGLDSGAVFNLVQDHWDRLRADAFVKLPGFTEGVRLEGGYLRSRPHFGLDSIFNFFSPAPFGEFRGGLRWDPRFKNLKHYLSFRLSYTHRSYQSPAESEMTGDGAGWDVDGLDFDGRMRIGSASWAILSVGYEDGSSGRRWLVAPRVFTEFYDGILLVDARGILTSFEDPVQENQHALTIGCSAALTWRFGDKHALMLLAQLNRNRFHPAQFRLLAVLDLAFHFGSAGYFR